jgi:hypothetical protein
VVVDGALEAAVKAVHETLEGADDERAGSRTTLTVACVGSRVLTVGGFGDSKSARIRSGSSKVLWKPAPFLGLETGADQRWLAESALAPGDWVVVASDGLLDFLGRGWERRLEAFTDATPGRFVKRAIEAAFAGGAGDHVGLAVAMPSGR